MRREKWGRSLECLRQWERENSQLLYPYHGCSVSIKQLEVTPSMVAAEHQFDWWWFQVSPFGASGWLGQVEVGLWPEVGPLAW